MNATAAGWPDFLIAAALLIGAIKGWRKGFIGELAGVIALILALLMPWFYRGGLDGTLATLLHVWSPAAHVVAMVLIGIATYAAVLLVAHAVGAILRLPFLGTGNAAAGAAIGLLKAALLVWIVLYVALFFPLSAGIRSALHASTFTRMIAGENDRIDDSLIGVLPPFARPFAQPIFDRHRI